MVNDVYKIANRISGNLKMTSDNVEMADCFFLCANKQQIEDLMIRDHQVIWGRRGTGKTTLLKAFTYKVNNLGHDSTIIALYIVMAKVIPTEDEINILTDDGSSLAVYVFTKLIHELCKELESLYNERTEAMSRELDEMFLTNYYELQDYLELYQTYVRGGELNLNKLRSSAIKEETKKETSAGIDTPERVLNFFANVFKKKNKVYENRDYFEVTGKLSFRLETQLISEWVDKMMSSLGISLAYICLDEYSEIDKVSEFSIQSKVAQLIKQVFFKRTRYSVKIATIWNRSKLHQRGGNRVEGIEYQQDIFAGPDLDIMFMENNIDILNYFKEILINTYLMNEVVEEKERNAQADYIEETIFGESGLRHLICGSQGVSRAFVILVKEYLKRFIKEKSGPVKSGVVYEIIKHQYMEDVRSKVPYYSLYEAVETFVSDKQCRYFLIRREDYERCRTLIKYLASRAVFMQLPGHLTNRKLRNKYKLFIIHYGSFLDALDSYSFLNGRKKFDEDSKLEKDDMLLPQYANDLIENPDKYTVSIPKNAENEIYCTKCHRIFVDQEHENSVCCPYCDSRISRFDQFICEVAI